MQLRSIAAAGGPRAGAAAAAAVANGWCESPVTIHLAGGDLLVALDGAFNATLTGPAQEICSGEVSEELLGEVR
jgi:diaminopimelate epimerase